MRKNKGYMHRLHTSQGTTKLVAIPHTVINEIPPTSATWLAVQLQAIIMTILYMTYLHM